MHDWSRVLDVALRGTMLGIQHAPDDVLVGRKLVMWCGEEPRLLPADRWE